MARRLLLLLIVQGCVSIPDHELSTIATGSDLGNTMAEALADGSFTVGDFPKSEWWKEYNDEILNGLVDLAVANSPSLKLAEERLKAAAQVSKEKRAILFPELAFDGADNYEHFSRYGFFRTVAPTVPAVVNDITLNLSYKWELDFWGKNRNIMYAALGEMKAREAEVEAAKLILTTSIVYTYAELQFLLRKKELVGQKLVNGRFIWSSSGEREKHALDTSVQVLLAEAKTLDAEAQLVDVDLQIMEHIHLLKALAGLGQDAQVEAAAKPLNMAVAALPENLSLDLIARRPDLAAQRERVEAAAKEINAAKTDFYPSVNLIGFAGLETITADKLFRIPSFSGSFEPAVHLPIFTAGRIRAQLMEKVAIFNQAVQNYNDLILKAAQEVADHLSEVMQIQKEIAIREKSVQVAFKQEQFARNRFEHAVDDRISLYYAQNNLLDTQIVLTSLEYGKQLANILLIRSLGGGTHE